MNKIDNIKGIVWMMIHVIVSVIMNAANRNIAEVEGHLHKVYFISCYHISGFLLVLLYVLLFRPFSVLNCSRPRTNAVRGMCYMMAQILMLYAYTNMEFVRVSAITLFYPILACLAVIVIFRHKVGVFRLIGIIVGFIGAMIVVKPSVGSGFSLYSAYIFLAMVLWIVFDIITNKVYFSDGIEKEFINMYMFLALSFGVIMTGMEVPVFSLHDIIMLLCMGVLSIIFMLSALLSMRYGDIPVVTPFFFLNLVGGIIVSTFVFDEEISLRILLGSGIIISSASFILYREYRAEKMQQMQEQSRLNL